MLDIILIQKRSAAELALLAAEVALGTHLTNEAIIFRRAAKVTINSKPGMWFNVDGELVGNEPARFEILTRALRFMVPKP
jgi:diacylglycerol kinase (ATP)